MTKEKIERRLASWKKNLSYALEGMEDAKKFPVFIGTPEIIAEAQERIDRAEEKVNKYQKMLDDLMEG